MANMFGKALRGIADNPQPDLSVNEVGQSMRNFLPISTLSNPLKGAVKYGRNVVAGIAGKLGDAVAAATEYKLPADYPAQRNKFIADNQIQPPDATLRTGSVGLQKMGPSDLSLMSNGTVPPRSTPVRKIAGVSASPGDLTKTAKNPSGLAVPAGIVTPQQLPAGDRTYEYKAPGITDISENSLDAGLLGDNAAFDVSRKKDMQQGISTALSPQEIQNYNIGANGGIASFDGKTFILPSRGADEEQQYQAQQAQWKAEPQGMAQAPQQTSTVGYGNGIETYGADGNMISSTRKLDSTASVGDLMMEKFNTNQQTKRAGINNINSEIASRSNKDGIAAASLPLDLAEKSANIRNKNFATDSGIALHPLVVQDAQSITANRDSEKNTREKLSPLQLRNYESEIKAREASTRREDLIAPALATKHLADAAESTAKLNLILSGKGTGAGDKEDARFFYDMAKGMADGTIPMTPQMAAFLKSKGLYQPPAK